MALWLAMTDVSGLSKSFLDSTGRAVSFTQLSSPLAGLHRGNWKATLAVGDLEGWASLLRIFLVVDFAFIAMYASALVIWSFRLEATWGSASANRLRGLTIGLAACDIVENLLMWQTAGARSAQGIDSGTRLDILAGVTTLKWVLAGFVGVFALRVAWAHRSRVRELRSALWIQRYSLMAFLPIALLACLPLSSVFDQLPDIVKAWVQGPGGSGDAILALVMALLLTPVVFLLGRIRADCAWRREQSGGSWPWYGPGGAPRQHHMSLWMLGPMVSVGLAAYVWLSGHGTVAGGRLLVFCAVPAFVVGSSLWLRHRNGSTNQTPDSSNYTNSRDIQAVGDILTVAALAISGLGLVRALFDWFALGRSDLIESYPSKQLAGYLIVGAVLAVGPWLVANGVLVAIEDTARRGPPSGGAVRHPWRHLWWIFCAVATPGFAGPKIWLRIAMFCVGGLILLALCLFPTQLGRKLGVVAAVTLALATLVILVGVTVAYAQERQSPELFQLRWLRLEATPIVPVLLLAMVLAARIGDPAFVHPVDAKGPVPARPTLSQAFNDWLRTDPQCKRTVDIAGRNYEVRPMLMIGAEGGGLRATYWTANALTQLADEAGLCAQHAALFSTGASGGALGVTISRFADKPAAAVKAITNPDALAAATISLVTSDMVASTVGIRVSSPVHTRADHRPVGEQNVDRAGLMELVWEDTWASDPNNTAHLAHEELFTRFLPTNYVHTITPAPDAITGHVILTSTDSFDGCRGLISQIDLSGRPQIKDAEDDLSLPEGAKSDVTTPDAPGCGLDTAGPSSYDVFGAFGENSASDGDHCLGNIPAITAGLLASRFPYITPSGVVGGCRHLLATPLVDGGYAENTGLGTIVDLAPTWSQLVRDHNDAVLNTSPNVALTSPLVVPMVVYLDNGTGTDYSLKSRGRSTLESLLPPVTLIRAKSRQPDANAFLRQSATLTASTLCSTSTQNADCAAFRAVEGPKKRVFVIHQDNDPSLSAPLGWTLSEASQTDLDADLKKSLTRCVPATSKDPACRQGNGSLQDLIDRTKAP